MAEQPPVPGGIPPESKVPGKARAFTRDFGIGFLVPGVFALALPVSQLFRSTGTRTVEFLIALFPPVVVVLIGIILIYVRKKSFAKLSDADKELAKKGGTGGFIGGFFAGILVTAFLMMVMFAVGSFVILGLSGDVTGY